MSKHLGIFLLLSSLFISCAPKENIPEENKPLDFNTHGSVLRGTYAGIFKDGDLKGKELKIDVTAKNLTETDYQTEGTGLLNDLNISIKGVITNQSFIYKDGNTQKINMLGSPKLPPMADLSIKPSDIGITTNLTCVVSKNEPYSWTCKDTNVSKSNIILKKVTQ